MQSSTMSVFTIPRIQHPLPRLPGGVLKSPQRLSRASPQHALLSLKRACLTTSRARIGGLGTGVSADRSYLNKIPAAATKLSSPRELHPLHARLMHLHWSPSSTVICTTVTATATSTLQHTSHCDQHHVFVNSGDAPLLLLLRLVSREVHGECEQNMGREAQIAGVQHTARVVFSCFAQHRFAYEISFAYEMSPSRD